MSKKRIVFEDEIKPLPSPIKKTKEIETTCIFWEIDRCYKGQNCTF